MQFVRNEPEVQNNMTHFIIRFFNANLRRFATQNQEKTAPKPVMNSHYLLSVTKEWELRCETNIYFMMKIDLRVVKVF